MDRLHARRVARQLPDNNDDDDSISMEFGVPDEHQGHVSHASTTTQSEFAGAEEAKLEYREDDADGKSTTPPREDLLQQSPGVDPEKACLNWPCHNGTCQPDLSNVDGFTCNCLYGFTGTYCEVYHPEMFTFPSTTTGRTTGRTEDETDVLESADEEDAQMHPKDEVYVLVQTGAEDSIQTRDEVALGSAGHGHARAGVDPEKACLNWPCHNGTCQPDLYNVDGFTCNCLYGFTGKYCEVYHPEMFATESTTAGRTTTTRGWGPPANPSQDTDPPGYQRSDDAAVQRVSACLVVMATGLLLGRHL